MIIDPESDQVHALPPPEVFARFVGAMGIAADDTIVVYDGPGIFTAPRLAEYNAFGDPDGGLLYSGQFTQLIAQTVGVLVAFIAALNNFFDPIQSLSQFYTTYQAGMAALDKIFELLDEEPELRDAPGAVSLPRIRGEIEFDDVQRVTPDHTYSVHWQVVRVTASTYYPEVVW